ncbi:MAG: hypothetical protein ACRD63_13530 [Pyrinomonadaceae bacterium]
MPTKISLSTYAIALRLLVVCTICCSILGVNPALRQRKALAQTTELTLKPKANGFAGTYKPLGKDVTLLLETYHPSKEFSMTRIQRQDKSTLAEVLYDKDKVALTIRDVEITIDVVNRKILEPENLEKKLRKLEQFAKSEEAAQLRSTYAKVIQQRMKEERHYLFGFLVLSMALGEETNGSATSSLISHTPVQAYIDYRRQKRAEQAKLLNVSIPPCAPPKSGQMAISTSLVINRTTSAPNVTAITTTASAVQDCTGCCGPGCWGCTGVIHGNATHMTTA